MKSLKRILTTLLLAYGLRAGAQMRVCAVAAGDLSPLVGACFHFDDTTLYADTAGLVFPEARFAGKTVEIVYPGYEVLQKRLPTRNSGLVVVYLEPLSCKVGEVLVTARRADRQFTLSTPVPVHVIPYTELRKAGTVNLTEILASYQPGLSFSGGSNHTSVQMNGLGAEYVLILLDGERLAGETNGNIDYNRLNTLDVERVEISHGAMAARYGSKAIAGVINIISRKPLADGLKVEFRSHFARFNEWSAGGSALYRNGKLCGSTSALYQSTDGFHVSDQLFQFPYRDVIINQKLNYKLSNSIELSAATGFYHHERFDGLPTHVHPLYRDFNLQAGLNWLPDTSNRFSLVWYTDSYVAHDVLEKLNNQTRKAYVNRVSHLRTSGLSTVGNRLNMLYGFELLGDYLFSTRVADTVKTRQTLIGYASAELQLLDKFSFNTGLRIEHSPQFGSIVSPAFALKYAPGCWQHRLSVARGFRAPSLKEMYMQWDHNGLFQITGNPQLKPETSWYSAISSEYARKGQLLMATLYTNRVRNMILETDPATDRQVTYLNALQTNILGFTLMTETHHGKHLNLRGGYSLVHVFDTGDRPPVSNSYPHSAQAGAGYDFMAFGLNQGVALRGNAYSRKTSYFYELGTLYTSDTDPYMLWDLIYHARFPFGLFVSASLKNLFNYTDYVDYSTFSPGRVFFVSATWSFSKLSVK